MEKSNGDIIIYQTEDGLTKIDVKIENETVWLSQQQMAELFSTSRTNIIEHINNIYSEEELDKNSTCQNFRQVQKEGNRNVTREIPFYNLDMIISLGYRVKSSTATHFRKRSHRSPFVQLKPPADRNHRPCLQEIRRTLLSLSIPAGSWSMIPPAQTYSAVPYARKTSPCKYSCRTASESA